MSCDILQEYRNEILPPLVVGKAPARKAMKERTIELCLLAGIVLLSAFIVMMLTKQFVLPFAGRITEGFQSAATAGAASPPPNLQKMMMVLLGPGSGTSAADGDVFLSKIGTDFTDPVWEKYPPDLATTTQTIGKFPPAAKIRIDGGGGPDSWLNFLKIRLFDRTNKNVNSLGTAKASSIYQNNTINTADKPLNADAGAAIFHSNEMTSWYEVTLSTATELSKIEIDNRPDCCFDRLASYRLRVYDSAGNEFFSRPLTADLKQSYSLTERERTVTIQGSGSMAGKEGSNMAVKLRIDGGGATNVTETLQPYLNFHKIRIFNTAGVNINSTTTATASSFHNDQTKPSNLLSSDPNLSVYHSRGMVGEWVELTLSTPSQISRIEIDNRQDCCQGRLVNYTLRVYNTYGIEIYSKRLTADNKQTYTLTAQELSTPMATISGAEGRLYATNSASAIFATKPYTKTSEGVWNKTGGALSQVSRDTRDGRTVCGVQQEYNDVYCSTKDIEFSPSWKKISGKCKWISISIGRAACIGADNTVKYTRNYMEGGGDGVWWQDAQSNLGSRLMKQVVLDETRIGAIDMEGIIYMADLTQAGIAPDGGITGAIKWFQIAGKRARFLEMRLGRVLIIAEDDGKIYYGDDYRYGRWQAVPMPDTMREVFMAGKDSGFGYSFKRADAEAECKKLGATLATRAQLQAAWRNGANWCSCAWTADSGKLYPNNENMTGWCGGAKPELKDCGSSDTDPGNATCFGKKPTAAGNVARFNTKFWNAPPLAIEFVPFSSTLGNRICGTEGTIGTFKGATFRYYRREECATVEGRITDGRQTEYDAGTGECTIKGGQSLSRQLCINLQDVPDAPPPLTQDAINLNITNVWNDGSSGDCLFNADAYKKKYGVQGDPGQIYQHWLDTGLAAGYSPCGDLNPSCRWDPDAYYNMNPTARGQQPNTAIEHYKQVGIKQGFGFCQATGVYPLMEALKRLTQSKRVIPPRSTTCRSSAVTSEAGSFGQQQEVYLVTTSANITKDQGASTCSNLGATVASRAQLQDAQLNGAQWCTPGWLSNETNAHFSVSVSEKCGGTAGTGIRSDSATSVKAVHCYGVKPARGSGSVLAFNQNKWSQHTGAIAGGTRANAARWTCPDRAAADALFNGPGNADETYLDTNDSVCYTSDSTSNDFFCRTAQEYRNGEDYSSALMDSYELSCNNLAQGLTDLSGAITTLNNIKGGIGAGLTTIEQAGATLQSVYDKNNCDLATTAEMKGMCAVLKASRDKIVASSQRLTSTEAGKEGVYAVIQAPVQQATLSRDKIRDTFQKLQCKV